MSSSPRDQELLAAVIRFAADQQRKPLSKWQATLLERAFVTCGASVTSRCFNGERGCPTHPWALVWGRPTEGPTR